MSQTVKSSLELLNIRVRVESQLAGQDVYPSRKLSQQVTHSPIDVNYYQDIDLVVCPGLFEGQFYGPGRIDVLLTSHSGEAFRSTRNQLS